MPELFNHDQNMKKTGEIRILFEFRSTTHKVQIFTVKTVHMGRCFLTTSHRI